MNFYALSALINALTSGFLGVFVLLKQNNRKFQGLLFFLFCFTLCWWSSFYFVWQLSDTVRSALIFSRLFMMGAIFIPPVYYHYNVLLISRSHRVHSVKWGYWIAVVLAATNFSTLFIRGVEPRGGFKYWPIPGPLFHVHLAIFSLTVVGFISFLFSSFRRSTGLRREQMRYSLLATIFGFGGGMTNYLLWYKIPIKPIGNICVSGFVSIIAYTILRYQLMDINLAARYTTIYGFYILIAGIPLVVLGLLLKVGAGTFALLLMAVISGPLVYTRFRDDLTHLVDRLPPFRGRYVKFDRLQEMLEQLTKVRSTKQWAQRVMDTLTGALNLSRVGVLWPEPSLGGFLMTDLRGYDEDEGYFSLSFRSELISYLKNVKKTLARDWIDASFSSESLAEVQLDFKLLKATALTPVFHNSELAAVIVLGPRDDGKILNDWDLAVLAAITSRAEQVFHSVLSGMTAKQMTAIWAHDLRRPFDDKGSFRFIGQILRGDLGEVPPQVKQVLSLVMGDVRFVERHIRRLIRPGEDEEMDRRPSELSSVYSRIQRIYSSHAAEKKVDWIISSPPEDMRVYCDPDIIEHRVIANLVVNAIRHTPSGGKVYVGYKLTPHSFVGIVRDTGVGIPSDQHERIFKAGVQLDGENSGLAGLGLTSVKDAIVSHRGRVWLESVPGKGSCFYFEIPLLP